MAQFCPRPVRSMYQFTGLPIARLATRCAAATAVETPQASWSAAHVAAGKIDGGLSRATQGSVGSEPIAIDVRCQTMKADAIHRVLVITCRVDPTTLTAVQTKTRPEESLRSRDGTWNEVKAYARRRRRRYAAATRAAPKSDSVAGSGTPPVVGVVFVVGVRVVVVTPDGEKMPAFVPLAVLYA